MNIFWLDEDLELAAMYHCNKHAVKMVTEYAQLLSTAYRLTRGSGAFYLLPGETLRNGKLARSDTAPYALTHVNHPCAVWARASRANYAHLHTLARHLGRVYTARYGRIHLSSTIIDSLVPKLTDLPDLGLTPLPIAMPEDCRGPDVVEAYRKYYRVHKRRFAKWDPHPTPEWFDKE